MNSTAPKILLVDDDESLLQLVSMRLKANNYEVNAVESGSKAVRQLASFRPDVVVTDLKMPDMDGMQLFEEIQQRDLRMPVIVLTANGTIPDAVDATQKGVFSYLVKPFNAELLLKNLEKALKCSGQASAQESSDKGDSWRSGIISRSPSMESLLQQTHAAAVSGASILIQSETGTGKELLAQAIHKASSRHTGKFIPLNCAAIPETLIESELFGHAAGSFTGATKASDGLFKAAHGGTIFLDEIGDMPLAAQGKLLRVLEQREVRAVGSTAAQAVDVRIVAATHQDLEARIRDGSFRQDLYYRLNVITLELPPLRERPEDILLLAEHFCASLAHRNQREPCRFSPAAAELLISAPWPGNVRQLYNVVEQCVALSTTNVIPDSLVRRSLRFRSEKLMNLTEAKEQFEYDYLLRVLNLTEGNISLAARLAGRNRSEFYNLLHRHGLEPTEFRK